jgi:hypothetical protein
MSLEPSDRRFTDQEVALVLRRAAELEDRRESNVANRGITKLELESIAREAGFSIEAVQQAIIDLGSARRFPSVSYLGASPVSKRIHAVPKELDRNELPSLVQIVEDRIAMAGTITEALGSVRWTSVSANHHFTPVTQVTVTPAEGETRISVSQRFDERVRRIVHLLPTLWGGMAGVVVAAAAGMTVLPGAISVAGVAAVGFGIGRKVWQSMASRSGNRVERLTAELVEEAKRISGGSPQV